jgi:hypothetical protein
MKAIQFIENAKDENEAKEMLSWAATQVDYIGGRFFISYKTKLKGEWVVQIFYEDVEVDKALLPDGCMRVFIPESQKVRLGIK